MTTDQVAPITYDIPTAAELIGCSVHWLTVEIRAKRVPHSRFGWTPRLTEEHMREIARLRTVQPVAPPRPDITAVPTIPPRRRPQSRPA